MGQQLLKPVQGPVLGIKLFQSHLACSWAGRALGFRVSLLLLRHQASRLPLLVLGQTTPGDYGNQLGIEVLVSLDKQRDLF